MMDDLWEWLNLSLRWLHVLAGIMWVGQTYFFSWLDHQITAAEDHKVWMVHSGGFYIVDKQKIAESLPRRLYWFRWEAAVTFVSGLLLLVVVYYAGGALNVHGGPLSTGQAIGLSVGILVVGWFVYDLLCVSPLGKNPAVFGVTALTLVTALGYGLTQVFSGRGAYMQVGALFGTIMVTNVWVRILPAQRNMISAAQSGGKPDMDLGERAKQRSMHNTYMTMPLIVMMVSNHFPTISYGNQYNWLVLSGVVVVGWAVRHVMIRLGH